jgi:hypothetical protein
MQGNFAGEIDIEFGHIEIFVLEIALKYKTSQHKF